MAVPKKKISRSAGKARRTAWTKRVAQRLLNSTHLVKDKTSGELRLSHHTPQVAETKTKADNKQRIQA